MPTLTLDIGKGAKIPVGLEVGQGRSWNDANINTMKQLHGTDFEVVRMTGLVVR